MIRFALLKNPGSVGKIFIIFLMVLLLPILSVAQVASSPPPTAKGSALAPPRAGAGFSYEFAGVFTWGEVITSLCKDGWCRTQLPRDFHSLEVPLNIYENSFDNAFKALSLQALADGYILKKSGSKKPFLVVAELDKEKNASYVSCLDTLVKSVPAADLYRYKYADSLKCFARASLLDSLASVVPDSTISSRYRVSFYVVSSSFVRGLGVDWTSIWAKGDLNSMPSFITDWTLKAVADNDTTAEFRSIDIDLDSSATIHWGSQKKEEKSTIVYSNGVAQTDYDWRNYGLTLSLSRSKKQGVKVNYSLAQRDENNSILSGKFGGGGSDSVVTFGVYDSYQTSFVGVPWLSSIPLIGYIFGHETLDKVKSFFVIQVFKVVPDTVFTDFPLLDSLKTDDVQRYEGGSK